MIRNVLNKIEEILDELVTDTVIAERHLLKFATNINNENIAMYPAAILGAPVVTQSVELDNCTNDRTYIIPISVICGEANDTDLKDVAEKAEQILNKFDARIRLDGTLGDGHLFPTTQEPYIYKASKDLVVVDILLNVHIVTQLDFIGQ